MKRAILFTAITALVLGISGFRPALANGALNHRPRLTVKIARPGLVEKVHHRRFSRGRGHRFSRGRGYRFSRGRGHRVSRGRGYRFGRGRGHRFSRGRGHRFSRGRGHRFSHGRGYHRHYYRLFPGAVVTRWHWHRWPGYGGRQFSQRRHHR